VKERREHKADADLVQTPLGNFRLRGDVDAERSQNIRAARPSGRGAKRGLAALCLGGGNAVAMIVENK